MDQSPSVAGIFGDAEPTSDLTPPITAENLGSQVRSFISRFHVAEDNAQVTERLLDLMRQFPTGGKQVHDANIVATMLTHNIPTLLTHNVADFARFSSFIIILPLETKTP